MPDIEVSLTSDLPKVLEATQEAIHTALEAVGVQAEAHAVAEITAVGAVDTGRLRNSITHAVSGDPGRTFSYTDDNGNGYAYTVDDAGDEADNTVYLGTNVEYAAYVEMGTVKMAARPYIRPAIEDNISEYKAIFEEILKQQLSQ